MNQGEPFSHLLIDLLYIKALGSSVEVCQCTLVGCIFTVKVILLGSYDAFGAAASISRLTDCARFSDSGFIGSSFSIIRLVV